MLAIGVAAALSFSPAGGGAFPTVTAHGMGDSCFNSGMKEITALIGTTLGTYSVCIPTGNRLTDTTNGFLMTMNDNVDVFAAKILKDAQLKDGFNCVGFSQGVSLCRGYVQKYNGVGGYPAVQNFLSVHGTCSGVAGFPNCDPDGLLGPVCKPLAHLVGDIAYTAETQKILFQIDYYRDPNRVGTDAYKQNSQIADWNNEGVGSNATYKANFVKVKRFIMIKALKDTMIYPNEGEWWGHFADGSLRTVLPMKETKWYKDDLFGLKTVDEAGKLHFNTTEDNHLQFSKEQLAWWVKHQFV
jgi:palmitoyl-protein thioesterase